MDLHRVMPCLRRLVLALLIVAGLIRTPVSRAATPGFSILTGSLAGAAYAIAMPTAWNGTLFLYSHGYVAPGEANSAPDFADDPTSAWLLGHGFALAGSAFSGGGWVVRDALREQIAVLDYVDSRFGTPKRTIAWGHSFGGMIAAGLLQDYPGRFAGGLPMCGVLGGSVATWNGTLDAGFALKTLLAPTSQTQLVNITIPLLNLAAGVSMITTAQRTAAGQARLALAAALGGLPGWYDPSMPRPAATDIAAQERNQFQWLRGVDGAFIFALRADVAARAGGNPSWNTGVDYTRLLARSSDYQEVRSLYARAGMSLDADLRTLQRAPRIAALPKAVDYLARYITFNGRIRVPVLTVHTIGDGLVPVEHEQAYAHVVRSAGNADLLRQAFVARAGHCTFTDAEMIAAIQALIQRLDTGRWDDLATPQALEQRARALGPGLDGAATTSASASPAFVSYSPPPFLRPYDGRAGS